MKDDVDNRSSLKNQGHGEQERYVVETLLHRQSSFRMQNIEMLFQSKQDNPMIHKLRDKMTVLVKDILVRFVTTEALDIDLHDVEFFKPENHLARNQIHKLPEICDQIIDGSRCDNILKSGDI